MRQTLSSSVCLMGLLALSVGACSGSDDVGGIGGVGGGGGTAGAGAELRTYLFFFGEYDPDAPAGQPFRPLEGVRACEMDTAHCATTDSLGQVDLDVPVDRAVAFTMEKEGYGAWIHADLSDENFGQYGTGCAGDGRVCTLMYTDAQLEAFAAKLDTTYPWTNGMVALVIWPPRSGVTFSPVGPTVDAVGDLFYYDLESQGYRRDLEATTTWDQGSAYLPLTQGGFIEVTPGVHEFELGGNIINCSLRTGWSWPGSAPNRIRAPVRAGFTTYASLICDE